MASEPADVADEVGWDADAEASIPPRHKFQYLYLACALRWLVNHDGKTQFTTADVHRVYRYLVPVKYRLTTRELAVFLRRRSKSLGIRVVGSTTYPTDSHESNSRVALWGIAAYGENVLNG